MSENADAEDEVKNEHEQARNAAFLQVYRVAAVFGALLGRTLPALFGLAVTIIADVALSVPPTMAVAGAEVSVLFLGKAAFTIEALRGVAVVTLTDEPEVHKIES